MDVAFTDIAFAPTLAPWLLWTAGGVALAAALAGLLLRARGAVWRTLLLALLMLALLEPSLVRERREPEPDTALIVVDQSRSQSFGTRRDETEQALAAVRERMERIPGLETRVVRTEAGAASETTGGSRLMEAARRALADVPQGRRAGVVMLTDGQVHDADTSTAGLPPVHALLSGRPGERDRRLAILEAPAYGIVGEEMKVRLRVDDLPQTEGDGVTGDSLPLTVRRDGVIVQSMRVSAGREADITLSLDHAGRSFFEIEAAPAEHEITLDNNRATLAVNGVRDRLRVLLISGKPHAGERVWRNFLKSDPAVDLVHFTILRPPHKQDVTPVRELSLIAFPIRELFEEKLHDFDLVIFDRYTRRGLIPPIYLANIADYVRGGGALLEAAGPSFAETLTSLANTPLRDILPAIPTGTVHLEPFRPAVSEIGHRHPVTAGLAPDDPGETPHWGRWFRQIDADRVHGDVLMTGAEGRPLVVLDRVGEGRVAQVLSDHIWLWARGYDGGGPHGELLRRLAHWLMKEPDLEENALLASASGGRLRVEHRSLDGTYPEITVTDPEGRISTLTLDPREDGHAVGSMETGAQGLYRVSDGERTVIAAVGEIDPIEMRDVRASSEPLKPVAAATGGSVRWLSEDGVPDIRMVGPDRAAAGRGWIGLRANGDYTVTGVEETPLLPPLAMLILLTAALGLAWRRESR